MRSAARAQLLVLATVCVLSSFPHSTVAQFAPVQDPRFVSPGQGGGGGGANPHLDPIQQRAEAREKRKESIHPNDPQTSDSVTGSSRTAAGNEIDYHSAAALTVFIILCLVFWTCCCGWQFECLPQQCRVDPGVEGCMSELIAKQVLWLYALVFIAVWVTAGTLFFYFHNGAVAKELGMPEEWTFAQSFYYTCQSGWSVGFGALTEPDEWSMIYTTFHVCIGASFVAAALGIYQQRAVDRKNKRQLSNWATLAGGGFASDLEIDTSSCIGKFLTVEAIGASLNFLFFVVGGALFAHVMWEATLIEAVYFAITGLSTGGFLAPEVDDVSMW